MGKGWMTTGQVANRLGVDDRTIRRRCDAGEIPAARIGDGHWRIRSEWVESAVSQGPTRGEYEDGVVYFVRCRTTGLVKIGTTTDPLKRMRSIQSMCPTALECVSAVIGGVDREQAIHDSLGHKRKHGEWFALDDEDVPSADPSLAHLVGAVSPKERGSDA